MKNPYLVYCLLREKYHQACVTGRGVKALSDSMRELEEELWPRTLQPTTTVGKVDKDAR